MISVRVLEESRTVSQSGTGSHPFQATMEFETIPRIGDLIEIGDGNVRRSGEVVRTSKETTHKGSLFEVAEPWVVVRFS